MESEIMWPDLPCGYGYIILNTTSLHYNRLSIHLDFENQSYIQSMRELLHVKTNRNK